MPTVGAMLKAEREIRQISLEEVAQVTRIPLQSLRRLEADELESLPGEVFVRGFLRSYARALDLDPDQVLTAHGGVVAPSAAPAPLGSVSAPERGRRIGLVVALAILLLLFTLALSVVLRPRRLDAPVELSKVQQVISAEPIWA
ncbi:MAG: helix-turn-helix domain-containing protein [Deltaproteobacteria bacterium]|nr:helix-turn-helix domain-containing protein [Deltaproteobacteria bacterium]